MTDERTERERLDVWLKNAGYFLCHPVDGDDCIGPFRSEEEALRVKAALLSERTVKDAPQAGTVPRATAKKAVAKAKRERTDRERLAATVLKFAEHERCQERNYTAEWGADSARAGLHRRNAEDLERAAALLSERTGEREATVTCDDCLFRYGAEHTNADGSYSCPLCELQRVEARARAGEHERRVRLRRLVQQFHEEVEWSAEAPAPEPEAVGATRPAQDPVSATPSPERLTAVPPERLICGWCDGPFPCPEHGEAYPDEAPAPEPEQAAPTSDVLADGDLVGAEPERDATVRCSFCGRPKLTDLPPNLRADRFFAGPNGLHVCERCVGECSRKLVEADQESTSAQPERGEVCPIFGCHAPMEPRMVCVKNPQHSRPLAASPEPADGREPERFMDQIDADRAALDFIEREARRITDRPTNVETWALEQADGRVTVLWAGIRAVASATVVRDDSNFSVLFCWPGAATPPAPAGEWRPIETAPWEGHGKPVLLYRNREYFVAMRLPGANGPGWCTSDGFEIMRPTHWMPLPAAPQDATGEDE